MKVISEWKNNIVKDVVKWINSEFKLFMSIPTKPLQWNIGKENVNFVSTHIVIILR